jgi:hypothetical protein
MAEKKVSDRPGIKGSGGSGKGADPPGHNHHRWAERHCPSLLPGDREGKSAGNAEERPATKTADATPGGRGFLDLLKTCRACLSGNHFGKHGAHSSSCACWCNR